MSFCRAFCFVVCVGGLLQELMNTTRSQKACHILFSIGKGFIGDMVHENDWGELKSGGDELVVHWK